jgi:hypothetical protein
MGALEAKIAKLDAKNAALTNAQKREPESLPETALPKEPRTRQASNPRASANFSHLPARRSPRGPASGLGATPSTPASRLDKRAAQSRLPHRAHSKRPRIQPPPPRAAVGRCSICLEEDAEVANPVRLPCEHVFCRECLREHLAHSAADKVSTRRGVRVTCPKCRETHQLHRDDLDGVCASSPIADVPASRVYGWIGHKSGSGFSDLAPSILHSNWFWDHIP